MSLVKTPVRRTTTTHKKRTAAHHKQSSRYTKSYWPYLPIALIVGIGIIAQTALIRPKTQVLSYATNMSVSGLLQGTNGQRTASGLGSLALNGTLSQAAQAKAQDMATNNYWAHTSPSGLTPWYFIGQAGYNYSTAGENLAYGFGTYDDTITGWMNSPGHRANILNASFTEIGFGIINVANYQGSGEQTLVVAMYAAPLKVAAQPAAPAPATPAPAPKPVQTAEPAPAKTPTPSTTAQETPETGSDEAAAAGGTEAKPEESKTTAAEKTKVTPVSTTTAGQPDVAENTASVAIKRIDLITSANVAWTQFAVSMIMSVALLTFLLRHSLAWHRVLVQGERFVIHHPIIDIVSVSLIVVALMLLQTSGVIK